MNSPRSSSRAPHVVFLIDTAMVAGGADQEKSVEAMILRIVLFFLDCVDERMTWGYCLVDSAHDTGTSICSRRFFEATRAAVSECMAAVRASITASLELPATAKKGCRFLNLKKTLMQLLGDFQWKDIGHLGTSPRANRVRAILDRPSLPIVNYLYVLSHRPTTGNDLDTFVHGHSHQQHGKSRKNARVNLVDIHDHLHHAADELKRLLWEGCANQNLSISWIDMPIQPLNASDPSDADILIQSGFKALMAMFGGDLVPGALMHMDDDAHGLSFATRFHPYRHTLMYATPQFRWHVQRDHLTKTKILVHPMPDRRSQPLWQGPLTHLDKSKIDGLHVEVHALDKEVPSWLLELFSTLGGLEAQQQVALARVPAIMDAPAAYACALRCQDTLFATMMDKLKRHRLVLTLTMHYNASDHQENQWTGVLEPLGPSCGALTLFPGVAKAAPDMTAVPEEEKEPVLATEWQDWLPLQSTAQAILDDIAHHDPKDTEIDKNDDTFFLSLDMTIPAALEHLLIKQKNPETTPEPSTKPPAIDNAAVSKPARPMPDTVDALKLALTAFYLDTMYSSNYTWRDAIMYILSAVEHLMNTLQADNDTFGGIAAALQAMLLSSDQFDEKHRTALPMLLAQKRKPVKHPQEQAALRAWIDDMRKRNTLDRPEFDEMCFKALKIKDAKLQIVLHLVRMHVHARERSLVEPHKPVTGSKRDRGKADPVHDDLLEKLEEYFDRMAIWESVSSMESFLRDLDTEAADKSFHRIDPADINLQTYCTHLNRGFNKLMPSVMQRLNEKVDHSEDTGDDTDSLVIPKRRKTLLEKRLRGSSGGEAITVDWHKLQPPPAPSQETRSSQDQSGAALDTKKGGASQRKAAMFQSLPFMKREIALTKKAGKARAKASDTTKQQDMQANATRPTIVRAGSFTKSANAPKRVVKRKDVSDTNTVVLRKRVMDSPTTPRTRMAREFGVSLTPKRSSSSSKLAAPTDPSPYRSPTRSSNINATKATITIASTSSAGPSAPPEPLLKMNRRPLTLLEPNDDDSDDDDYDMLLDPMHALLKSPSRFKRTSKSPPMARTPTRHPRDQLLHLSKSPKRSPARKVIGVKSPCTHRIGSARDMTTISQPAVSKASRDLTSALLAAKSDDDDDDDDHHTRANVQRTFSSLFDDE